MQASILRSSHRGCSVKAAVLKIIFKNTHFAEHLQTVASASRKCNENSGSSKLRGHNHYCNNCCLRLLKNF